MNPKGYPATTMLAAGIIGGFLITWSIASHSGPDGFDSIDLVDAGAASADLVLSGQVWRLATAPFLHGSWGHLVGNLAAVILLGTMLERRIGSLWIVRIASLAALTQTEFSIASNPPGAITVGASGIVCALLACLLVTTQSHLRGVRRIVESGILATVLATLCLPSAGLTPDGIDIAAHLGGFITGLSFGFAVWMERAKPQALTRQAQIQAAVSVGLLACAGVASAIHLPAGLAGSRIYAPRQAVIRASATAESLEALSQHYPNDPRLAVGLAGYDIERGTFGQARLRLSGALAHPERLRPLGVAMPVRILVLLSYATLLDGDDAGARRIAGLVCPLAGQYHWAERDTVSRLLDDLSRRGLCGPSTAQN